MVSGSKRRQQAEPMVLVMLASSVSAARDGPAACAQMQSCQALSEKACLRQTHERSRVVAPERADTVTSFRELR
jgi:hypothetical protein